MKNLLFQALNIILIVAVIVGDFCYFTFGDLWLKSITSVGFVAIGIINLIYAIINKTDKLKFCIIMVVGLFFAMLGDILLEINFIIGAILFAVGHIFYFIAYSTLVKFKWIDLIAGGIIFVVSVLIITLLPIFNFGGIVMELLCIFYALIISLMLGKAISNFIRERNFINLLILIGSFFFFFSDLMLLLNVFASLHAICALLCIATYYPAECILAFSLSQTVKEKINNEEINKENNIQEN